MKAPLNTHRRQRKADRRPIRVQYHAALKGTQNDHL